MKICMFISTDVHNVFMLVFGAPLYFWMSCQLCTAALINHTSEVLGLLPFTAQDWSAQKCQLHGDLASYTQQGMLMRVLLLSCCRKEQAVKICMSISTHVRQPHFLRRPQRWWLPLHRSSPWHSDHRSYQESYPKSFKVTHVGGTDYRTLSYHIRSAPPMFQTCLILFCGAMLITETSTPRHTEDMPKSIHMVDSCKMCQWHTKLDPNHN